MPEAFDVVMGVGPAVSEYLAGSLPGHRVVDGIGEQIVSWEKSGAFPLAGDPEVLESE